MIGGAPRRGSWAQEQTQIKSTQLTVVQASKDCEARKRREVPAAFALYLMLKSGSFLKASSSFFPLLLSLGSLRTSEPTGVRSVKISKGGFCERARS